MTGSWRCTFNWQDCGERWEPRRAAVHALPLEGAAAPSSGATAAAPQLRGHSCGAPAPGPAGLVAKSSNSCNPVDCGLPGSSIRGISQARILEYWSPGQNTGLPFPSPWDIPDPGIEPVSCTDWIPIVFFFFFIINTI